MGISSDHNLWTPATDNLPLTGPHDLRFRAPYHEDFVAVLISGQEYKSVFGASLDYTQPEDGIRWPYKFVMSFDEPDVTHWRFCSEEEWELLPQRYEVTKEDKPCN